MDLCLGWFSRLSLIGLWTLAGCGSGAHDANHSGFCFGYPEEGASEYILPYQVGEEYSIGQGNCSGGTHSRKGRYAYDMSLPTGTAITAARAGEVTVVTDGHENGGSTNNTVVVEHDDGTFAVYTHLTKNGGLVSVGEKVGQGDTIALSGFSGTTGPHLHFSVNESGSGETIPVTFRNTKAHPQGLVQGEIYRAEEY